MRRRHTSLGLTLAFTASARVPLLPARLRLPLPSNCSFLECEWAGVCRSQSWRAQWSFGRLRAQLSDKRDPKRAERDIDWRSERHVYRQMSLCALRAESRQRSARTRSSGNSSPNSIRRLYKQVSLHIHSVCTATVVSGTRVTSRSAKEAAS